MRKEFTEKDLVAFGNYLLGQERRKLFEGNPSFNNELLLEERLSEVHHSDISNFKDAQIKSIDWDLKVELLDNDMDERSYTYKCVGEDNDGNKYEGIATFVCDELERIEDIEKIID